MPMNVAALLQELANAVEKHNTKAAAREEAKAIFEAADQDYHTVAGEIEALRAKLNDLLGQAIQSTRVRVG